MIRIVCPGCGSKLDAKDELAGQTRKCPKCGQPIRIVADIQSDESSSSVVGPSSESQVHSAIEEHIIRPDLPKRLNRLSCYLICNRMRLVAMWENKGKGWLVKTDRGAVSAKKNPDQLPNEGDFQLIELKLNMTPDGKRLSGLWIFQLALRWALTVLEQDEDTIVEKITGLGSLKKDQKIVVRQAIREQFMPPVWENATDVLEYLANADYHSHGVGVK